MDTVRIWEEETIIPTYEVGEPDKNPMFLEKRVYQGSSGKIYPYPTIETISHEKTDKAYKAVYLENEYIKVMILPELGGRIQRAYDKTNDYDFVYYNQVVKPALVGLCGPWISGGIEFNWPQHHRPTTYSPVDYKLRENADGSKTLEVNDTDQMYGTKGIARFTLYPGKAYIEIAGQLYNRTPIPQTFLWWANPAVSVNDDTQSVFPPDVHSVMDHGKRDVSRFPIAKGIYYKHDYSEGVDISRYKNIPVPTSYMAETSKYDFVGGYDYGKEAGLLHVADHHFSPGKKQWTWGCGDFGKAWDRNLTDEDGPYIELMTGVYTENQPDFSWLKPFEEKSFTQYFMPYKKVGYVKNATVDACLNIQENEDGIFLAVYSTGRFENALIRVSEGQRVIYEEVVTISPVEVFEKNIGKGDYKLENLSVSVMSDGRELVNYTPEPEGIPELAQPAQAAKKPEEIMTNEEILLTAQHIEQHRHATWLPDPYYLEGLKRDPLDSRINNAYGMLLYRRGCFEESEKYFRNAIKRLTFRSPNPYNSEAYYNLGLSLLAQKKDSEAYDAFYKAAWSSEQQEMSYYYAAVIQSKKKNYRLALELINKSLIKNSHNIKARGIKAVLLRSLGCNKEAAEWIEESLSIDPFDYLALYEKCHLKDVDKDNALNDMIRIMRDYHENYLLAARDYAEGGFYKEAVEMLDTCKNKTPMSYYYKAWYQFEMGESERSIETIRKAEESNPYCCFPNKLEDIEALNKAIELNPDGARAYYYLGNLYYDKLQFDKAIELWEKAVKLDDSFPTAHRNLGLAYFNKLGKNDEAREQFEKAFELDTTDSRIFLELDQLYKKLSVPFDERLARYEQYQDTVRQRDDAMLEWVTLLNLAGENKKAYGLIMSHHFRPWEGAEGKISGQYKISLLALAKEQMKEGNNEEARKLLEKCLEYPDNLGEGRLEGTKDNNIYYYLGMVNKALGDMDKYLICMENAKQGDNEPASAMYYYDQPADMILYKGLASAETGDVKLACQCFNKLMDYGERHINDVVEYDYFAVSLPDFLIFDNDLTVLNKAHCYYLMGLAKLGLEDRQGAKASFEEALKYDYNHQNCRIYKAMCE